MASRRKREQRKEFGRFSVVGFIATVIDYGVLNILANVFGFPLVASNVVSATTSSYVSYMLNKKVVFKDKAHSEGKTLLLYIGTLVVSILIIQSIILLILGHGLMQGFLSTFGLEGKMLDIASSNASKVIAGFATLAWNFFTQRKFVFESHGDK